MTESRNKSKDYEELLKERIAKSPLSDFLKLRDLKALRQLQSTLTTLKDNKENNNAKNESTRSNSQS